MSEEKKQQSEKELIPSADILKRIYDDACRDLEHGRETDTAREEAEWAIDKLSELGIKNPDGIEENH